MLTVRLVFCLYAEDANLFRPDALRDYVAASTPERLGEDLFDLFEVLDTPIEKRRRYLPESLKAFPYVDGGLFADRIDVPPLTGELRDALLEISEGFDWSGISPVIFGSLMEETLSHDERRKGGMHYTSVKNIHRLIDPLFLDGLKTELEGAEARPVAGGSRTNALNKLHDKIAGLRFLDPACGSGNFLTETYLELRRIENRILADLDNIQQGNALRFDWNELLPGDHCDYVMGNPPFIGHQQRTQQIKQDMELVCGKAGGSLDYVAGWYYRAIDYLKDNQSAEFAFVSTNSITQGQQVAPLFGHVRERGWHIRFAHRTFMWDAQTTDNANVHVVIIGFSRNKEKPALYSYADIKAEPAESRPEHVNGYLLAAPDVFVTARSQKKGPLSPMLNLANFGSMPLDNGNLLIETPEGHAEAMADPIAAKYVHPFRMGKELINNKERWCLWLADAEPGDMRKSKFISRRVAACREYRENATKTGDAYKNRSTPWLFRDNHQPAHNYLAIPAFFSGRREYATCDWYGPEIIAGNKIYTCDDPDGFNFAVMESAMFMTWQKAIGGRLKSDPGFSNTVVWNNLPLPQLSDELRQKVIDAGRGVIDARAKHEGQSLADLYDPDYMPTDLRAAHRELDKVADVAFGARKWLKDDDDARLQVLFKSYTRMTGSSEV